MVFPHVQHTETRFSLVLTTNVFQQASIISKQSGKINQKSAKLHVVFLVADTQYMSWKGNSHHYVVALRKGQLFYSSYLLPMRKKNLRYQKRDFSPPRFPEIVQEFLYQSNIAPTWSVFAFQRQDTTSKNIFLWRKEFFSLWTGDVCWLRKDKVLA